MADLNNILFFPVRLETRFDKTGQNKKTTVLKIRIIPDESQQKYEVDKLTQSDLDEGHRFWIRWFIASGDAEREFEEWRLFCEKHGVNAASRITSLSRPAELDKFRNLPENYKNAFFTQRPYVFIRDEKPVDISAACQNIYDYLSGVHISVDSVPKDTLTEKVNLKFNGIVGSLNDLALVLSEKPVVDYLLEKVNECLSYLAQRVDSIRKFYDRYEEFKKDLGALQVAFDTDYEAFRQLDKAVTVFLDNPLNCRTLEEMVRSYLENAKFCETFFGNTFTSTSSLGKSYPTPVLQMLPECFYVYGSATVDGKPFTISTQGNPIYSANIQVGIDFQSSSDGFNVDSDGNVSVPASLNWMVDYDEAVRKGMAITVNFKEARSVHVDYLYVYGVCSMANNRTVSRLFKSHLYWKDNFSLLKTGTPTNQVDDSRPVETLSKEELILEKYRLEILDEGCKIPDDTLTDGKALSELLGIDYKTGPFSRILNTENTELDNAKKAYRALWDYFEAKMVNPDYRPLNANQLQNPDKFFAYIRDFFFKYANGRGVSPVFRIDDQPFGIVPVCSLDRLSFSLDNYEKKYIRLFYDTIVTIEKRWKAICEKDLIASEGMTGNGADEKFLQMMAQNPRSVQFNRRLFYYGPRNNSDADNKGLVHANAMTEMLSTMGLNNPIPVADGVGSYDISDLMEVVKNAVPALADDGKQFERELLVSEFMDAFTHRIDIWYTAMMSYLIQSQKKHSLKAGSYGWVFNLKNTSSSPGAKGEYLMAPSIQHALTAAVLRSAYLQTKKDPVDAHMCINLTSMRARQALRMVDGIKAGMSTSLILGADLERYLHEAHKQYPGKKVEMNKFIYPLRKLFPQTIDVKVKPEDRRAQDYDLQVINGEALLNTFIDKDDWKKDGRIFTQLSNHAEELDWYQGLKDKKTDLVFKDDERDVLFLLIERMADSYDALNDLLLAEGVHRLVAGDRESFAAIAQFMSKGSGNLPSPAVLDTPVDYAVLAHKVGMALPRVTKENDSVLLKADPAVGAWIASQMGSLDKVVFYVDYTDGEERSSKKMHLSDIGLAPMEFLYLSSYPKVLVQTLEILWREKDWKNRKLGQVRILTGDPAELGSGEMLPTDDKEILLYEFSLLTDSLSSLLGYARTMRPGDIVPSLAGSGEEDDLVNVEELKTRYESVFNLLQQKKTGLDSFIKEIEGKDLTYEMIATAFGWVRDCTLAGLVNETIAYDTALILEGVEPVKQRALYDKILERQQKFIGQLKAISKALEARLESAAAIAAPGNAPLLTTTAYTEAIQTLTLKNLKVTCRFSVTGKTLPKEVNPAKKLGDNAFLDWVDEISEVRPGMKLFHELSMLQQMQGESALDRKKGIFQEQSQGKVVNEWLGCQVTDESLLDDTDSLVLFERQDFDEKTDNAGLVFDSWLEYIPFRKQTAGLVYRCDIPDAEAPQALLYALHHEQNPNKAGQWDNKDYIEVFQTADLLFRARTVDPDQLYANEENGLLGSLLTARKNDLLKLDPTWDDDEKKAEKDKQLDAARKDSLVMDMKTVDDKVKSILKGYQE